MAQLALRVSMGDRVGGYGSHRQRGSDAGQDLRWSAMLVSDERGSAIPSVVIERNRTLTTASGIVQQIRAEGQVVVP
jgi:hypothetical protein